VRLYKTLGLVAGPDPEQFAALADRVVGFEIVPDSSPQQ